MMLHLPEGRAYRFKCPGCFRVIRLRYRRARPLASCVGGPRPHPLQLLVCEDYDVYREMYAAWLAGAPMGRPLIHTRNWRSYPRERPGERVEDIADIWRRP